MKINLYKIIIGLILLLGPFVTAKAQEKVYVDIDNLKVLEVSDLSSFELLNSNEHVLGGIQKIQLIPEIGCLINSMGNLYLYEFNSNSITTKYSRTGRAEHEYSSITDFGYENGLVYIFDMNTKKILWFTIDGKYEKIANINPKVSSNPFCFIKGINEQIYIGKRVYSGDKTPALSLYNSSDLTYIKDVCTELFLRSGIMFFNPFFRGSDDDILYYDYFSYNIYSITPKSERIKYILDFGKFNLPNPENFVDEYAIIDELNNSNKRYATLISNIYEDQSVLSFMFIVKEGKVCTARYNKHNKKTDVWNISDKNYSILQIVPTNKTTYIFIEDLDGELYVGKQTNN